MGEPLGSPKALPLARENLSQLLATAVTSTSLCRSEGGCSVSLNHISREMQLPPSRHSWRSQTPGGGIESHGLMRTRIAVTAAVLAALALAAAPLALAGPGGISPPSQATPSGQAISQLYWFVFAICALVFVGVEAALVTFVIRFRRRRAAPAEDEGPQIHGNTRLEIIWTIIPAAILVGIAAVVFVRTPAVQATSGTHANELVIRVEAHQFYWQYVYPGGEISLDTLVLPVNRPVRLELTSFDVNHSWWVPELTGKRDAIPNRTIELRFRPTREGTYEGHCAELCGILHAVMPTTVDVLSASEYQDRLALLQRQGEAGAAQLTLGRETWDRVCAKCHGPGGEGDVGPAIAHSATLVSADTLGELVRKGRDLPTFPGYMPPVGAGWPDFQLRALIEYVKSNDALASQQQQ
jgi:cytochrome c oxidase subunit II